MTKTKALRPGATGPEGNNQTTTELAEGSVMNTVPQTIDIHDSLRELYFTDGEFDIREGYTGAVGLPEGDPHRVDQDETRSYKRGKDAYEGFAVVRAFDLRTGEEVKGPEGWLEEQLGDWDAQSFWIRSLPNTYVVNGEHLFVSGGGWVITGMTNTGELEFTAWSKLKAEIQEEEEDETREEWLGANAANIAAVQPAWADASLTWVDLVTVDDDGEITPDMMEFRRTVGGVSIEQSCAIDDGVFSLMGEPEIRITTVQDGHDGLPGGDAARIGVDMVAAAAMLGNYATVSDLHNAAGAARLNTGSLLEQTGL
ncbi:hypothetical protein AB6V29_01570 [Microbacterium sp. 20-116]|uniref:hypothetical protein n=1 Tax=Microbacterium sp. 20-116 TaxID=3239883 RepID=UPI0034E28EC0